MWRQRSRQKQRKWYGQANGEEECVPPSKVVQIVNPATTEKFGANSYPLPFFILKAVRHQILSLHGTKLFCRLTALSGDTSTSPLFHAYGYIPSLCLPSRLLLLPPPATPPLHHCLDTYLYPGSVTKPSS